MKLKQGSLTFDVPFFQAPLSGYSDYAMRTLARDFGCPFTFAGVMLAKSASHPKVIAKRAFRPYEDEHPVGAQILGAEPGVMVEAAKALVGAGYDLIDLNFACPATKVLRRGRGGALLGEPKMAIEIYERVREAIDRPVTVKIRIGYGKGDGSQENFWQIAEGLCERGIDGITVHGRSVLQLFRDKADWNIVRRLKEKYPATTIIGSGDLLSSDAAFEKFKASKVDGLCIARGAVGNPWIFRELAALFEGKEKPAPPTLQEQREVISKHFEMVCELYTKKKAVRYLRKFLAQYVRLHPQRKNVQADFFKVKNSDQFLAAIKKWYE